MILWIIIALMTAAAILAVLWPLARKTGPARTGSDLLVYQDQLEEIDRDRSAGMIGEAEAEAARIEVSRRLLAAADAKQAVDAPVVSTAQRLRGRRMAAVAALIVVPIVPLGFYLMLGSPDVPAQPAFARVQMPEGHESIDGLISHVEQHLAQNPKDGAGWEVIAPVYMRLGRYDDAVHAWHNALTINGESAERESDLGEALVAAASGVVTAEAKRAFEAAVSHDPRLAKARYFIGMAKEQDGDSAGAASAWRAMLDEAPPDAPWVPFVRQALARLTGEPVAGPGPGPQPGPQPQPGPSASDVAAASGMSDDQRSQMIRGMVAKLADRLHSDGSDVEGWLRLVRAYAVLGDRDKAKDAAVDARRALASHLDEVKRIDDLTKDLGIEVARLTDQPVAAPGPSASDVAAASNMSDDQRSQMIRGMVAKLADRLHSDGNDVEGWLRLVRSYVVLGDRDKAKDAAEDAKRALASHPDEVKRIDDLTKDLGIQG